MNRFCSFSSPLLYYFEITICINFIRTTKRNNKSVLLMQFVSVTALCMPMCIVRIVRAYIWRENDQKKGTAQGTSIINAITSQQCVCVCAWCTECTECAYLIIQIVAGANICVHFSFTFCWKIAICLVRIFFSSVGKICTIFIGFSGWLWTIDRIVIPGLSKYYCMQAIELWVYTYLFSLSQAVSQ